MAFLFFLSYCFVWIYVEAFCFRLVRLLVGRATAPVNAKERLAVSCGCAVCGLLPLIFLMFSPATTPFDLFFALFGGTFFGAVCGESWWLCTGR